MSLGVCLKVSKVNTRSSLVLLPPALGSGCKLLAAAPVLWLPAAMLPALMVMALLLKLQASPELNALFMIFLQKNRTVMKTFIFVCMGTVGVR